MSRIARCLLAFLLLSVLSTQAFAQLQYDLLRTDDDLQLAEAGNLSPECEAEADSDSDWDEHATYSEVDKSIGLSCDTCTLDIAIGTSSFCSHGWNATAVVPEVYVTGLMQSTIGSACDEISSASNEWAARAVANAQFEVLPVPNEPLVINGVFEGYMEIIITGTQTGNCDLVSNHVMGYPIWNAKCGPNSVLIGEYLGEGNGWHIEGMLVDEFGDTQYVDDYWPDDINTVVPVLEETQVGGGFELITAFDVTAIQNDPSTQQWTFNLLSTGCVYIDD